MPVPVQIRATRLRRSPCQAQIQRAAAPPGELGPPPLTAALSGVDGDRGRADDEALLQRVDAEGLVEEVRRLGLELDGRTLEHGGAVVVALERLQGAAVEEKERRARRGDLAVDRDLAGQDGLARVDHEVRELDLLAAAGQAQAAAAVVDLALDVGGDGAGLVVRDVAAADRERRRAGARDLGVPHWGGRELERSERLDEAAVEGDRG